MKTIVHVRNISNGEESNIIFNDMYVEELRKGEIIQMHGCTYEIMWIEHC